jgi:hypothetical protein
MDAERCTEHFPLNTVGTFVMSSTPIIPGHPNIQELGYVSPEFFITVEESQPTTIVNPNEEAQVSKTNGAAEFITYVTFNVPTINSFAGATADTKCFLVPLPDTVDANGSKAIEIFDLLPNATLTTAMTFNDRPNPNNQLNLVTFGGATGVDPVSMENFVQKTPNFGGVQQFQLRSSGDNDLITFTLSPVDPRPKGMALVIGNIVS